MRRRSSMAALLLGLLACSRPAPDDRVEPSAPQAVAPAPVIEAGLQWDPPLDDALTIVDEQVRLGLEVTLLGCASGGPCRVLLRLQTGAMVWAQQVSADRRHAFVGVTSPHGEQRLEIFDLEHGRQVGGVVLPGLPERGTIAWTPHATILYSWGSGTGVADVQLYSLDGELLMSDSGSAIARAESGRYFVLYPGVGTPRASDFSVRLYESAQGRLLGSYPDSPDTDFVDGLEWTPTQLRFDVHSRSGQPTRRETLNLSDAAQSGAGRE